MARPTNRVLRQREALADKAHDMSRDATYQTVLGGIAGVVHDAVRGHQTSVTKIARLAGLSVHTVVRMKDRETKNPQLYTAIALIRACDKLALLQLSELERFNRAARAISRALKGKSGRSSGTRRLRVIQGGRKAA